MKPIALLAFVITLFLAPILHAQEWLDFHGKTGAGKGKKIVLISGDEEYRSEESLPALARILPSSRVNRPARMFPGGSVRRSTALTRATTSRGL